LLVAQIVAGLARSTLPADRARGLRLLTTLHNEIGDLVQQIGGFEATLRAAAAEESRDVQQEAMRMMLVLASQDDGDQWDDFLATYFPWILERLVPFVQANDMRT
jgi:hypothetical protein